jgi:1-deoxy-D-xylulose-5-phosphate reductoisomerase
LKRLALFGSTGSIGRQTLDVAERLDIFDVVLLSARSNWKLLAEQVRRWKPIIVAIADESCLASLSDAVSGQNVRILAGPQAATEAALEVECDIALNALVGISGLLPSFELLKRGINLALANKESLVLAGELLNQIKAKTDAQMLPVDSEHSAIFQCLQGERVECVKRLVLTASGGPFRDWPREKIADATPEEALNHPTWKMGAKVTVDSASLMNKGLEIIEAYHLFGVKPDRIEVRIHPVSIVHSLIQFADGSFKAQLGRPDMRLPIQYALTYPNRLTADYLNSDDPSDWPELRFQAVDRERFPCLGLAYRALEMGGTAAALLNGADEVAVERFLTGEIRFGQIPDIIDSALGQHQVKPVDNIETVIEADRQGREFAHAYSR